MGNNSGKYKYLAKNVVVLTIAQFGSKILSFLLVPLYTSVLTTKEYGINDLFSTTVTLLIPFLTLNIVDSAIRFSIDKETDNKKVFSIALSYLIKGTVILAFLLILNGILNIFEVVNKYWVFFGLYFVTSAFSAVVSGFARGINHVTDVAVSGVICSLVLILSNIVLLIPFHMGLTGYFIAGCLGPSVQILYLFIRIRLWRYISIKKTDKKLKKEMVNYSKPMIANAVAWWINSASDRYIVTWICGVAVNGIYSIGYKIPTILSIFTNIFNQAWILSAVNDFDPEDKSGFFSNMYNLYNFAATVFCSLLIVFSRIIAYFLYVKEFFMAWKYVPFLLVAFVFSSLSGYIGGVFSAVKDSKIFSRSTVIGATINIVLNFSLIYLIGPVGAAIATLVSYFVIWLVRIINSRKYIKIQFHIIRDFIGYGLLLVQASLLFLIQKEIPTLYIAECVIFVIIISLFRKELIHGYNVLKEKLKNN